MMTQIRTTRVVVVPSSHQVVAARLHGEALPVVCPTINASPEEGVVAAPLGVLVEVEDTLEGV
jgi:hypothetical protein